MEITNSDTHAYTSIKFEDKNNKVKYIVTSSKWVVEHNDYFESYFYWPNKRDPLQNKRCVSSHSDIDHATWITIPIIQILRYSCKSFTVN